MISRKISGVAYSFGPPLGWDAEKRGGCDHLWVRVDRENKFFESAWEPTPDELEKLNKGASLILRILGAQPPVALYVEEPIDE